LMANQVILLPSQNEPVPLPVPPFQEAPLPPPQNTLSIPVVNQPGGCDGNDHGPVYFLGQAIRNYVEGAQNFFGCGAPLRMRVGNCFAEIFGCPKFSGDESCYGAAWDYGTYGAADPLTGHMKEALASAGSIFDSDPNFDQKTLDGSLNCNQQLIVTPNPNPPPPPPNGNFCTTPCALVIDSLGSRCVCDPPLPSPLPRAFRKSLTTIVGMRSGAVSGGRGVRLGGKVRPALKTAINPSLRVPVPAHISSDCGCGSDDFEEQVA
jgi:hypothetical protein